MQRFRFTVPRRRWEHLVAMILGVCLLLPVAAAAGGVCGDGFVDAGETCDDGGRMPGDCCSPDCVIEETGRCATCEDGLDNDRNGRIDAEDPGCATLAEYQRAAVVETDPKAEEAESGAAVRSVLLPGGLVGEAVDGRCEAAEGTCACPTASPGCQSLGRPCASDADCAVVPYPLGRSRGGLCTGDDAANDPAIGCRPESDLVARVNAITRIPGVEIDPIAAVDGVEPPALSFGGGKQVIDVESIEVGPEASVVLAGETDTVLVVRVRGELVLSERAAVRLAGELTADHVLWVFPGTDGRIALGDGAEFAGTILAPERRAVELGREVRLRGAILAANVSAAESGQAPVQFVRSE